MNASDYIALCALVVSLLAAGFTIYQHVWARRAKLQFQMSIGRGYGTKAAIDSSGKQSLVVVEEQNPTTRLLIRNMSNRPSGIIDIKVTNPAGSILMDVDGNPPGGQMPLRVEPWGIEIITTEWRPGEHTEDMYFKIKDIDDKEYSIKDYTNNRRKVIGENVLDGIELR